MWTADSSLKFALAMLYGPRDGRSVFLGIVVIGWGIAKRRGRPDSPGCFPPWIMVYASQFAT